MNEEERSLDESIEGFLEWRATRAEPTGLLEEIRRGLDLEPDRRRPFLWSGRVFTMGRLAWLGLLLALLAAAAIGVTVSGGKLGLLTVAPAVTPSVPQTVQSSSVEYLYCAHSRPLPFDAGRIDLTGAWTDRSELYFFRQQGAVVWGVGVYRLGVQNAPPLTGGRFVALRGTVGAGGAVHLDVGETGAIDPADRSQTPALANGSIQLRASRGPDGNVQLTTVSQSGSVLEGPGFKDPVFSPCVPSSTP